MRATPTDPFLRRAALVLLALVIGTAIAVPFVYPGPHSLWADTLPPGGGTIRDR